MNHKETSLPPLPPDFLYSLPEIDYADVSAQSLNGITLIRGLAITIRGGEAQVEVHRVQDEQGIYVRIYKVLDNNRKSALRFRLTDEAAEALCTLLSLQQRNPRPLASAEI